MRSMEHQYAHEYALSRIRTSHDRPPVPTNQYDWSAVTVDYEPCHPIGYGSTEQAAIEDLLDQLED